MKNTEYIEVKTPRGNYASINVIEYTADDTYVKPSNLLYARIICVGGGGGGGSGRCANGQSFGGGGGGGGALASRLLYNSEINPLGETITIGLGGAGGARVSNANGIDGTLGGSTSFGSLVIAKGGLGGLKGVITTPTPLGGVGGSMFTSVPNTMGLAINGGAGRQGSASGIITYPISLGVSMLTVAGGGGGSGSGFLSTFLQNAGGNGQLCYDKNGVISLSNGGIAGGGNGSTGLDNFALQIIEQYPLTSPLNTKGIGTAGGGGGGSTVAGVLGGNGGNGGLYGAGGGGGGAARRFSAADFSGAGGDGAQGLCVIIEYLK